MRKKILIADDDRSLRRLVRATLRVGDEEYDFLEAASGKEALEIARRELPELLLLDIMLPTMDGFAVCEQLKSDPLTTGITIVMLTAIRQPEDMERGKAVGADEYFTKPFSPLQLLQLVERIMREEAKDQI
jgi:CheY-like chemotaxis protein